MIWLAAAIAARTARGAPRGIAALPSVRSLATLPGTVPVFAETVGMSGVSGCSGVAGTGGVAGTAGFGVAGGVHGTVVPLAGTGSLGFAAPGDCCSGPVQLCPSLAGGWP